jgi:chromosome segregation ATPase
VEKEFEQLKHDYSDLNIKQKELINNCKTLEDENQNLLQTIEQLDQEKLQLKQTYEKSEENFSNQITQLIEQQSDKQHLESLQTRITNYENAVSQYEEYRLKLENNLQKITQQRDTHKMDLRLTKEMLTNKEQFEKDLQKQILELNQTIQVLIQLS